MIEFGVGVVLTLAVGYAARKYSSRLSIRSRRRRWIEVVFGIGTL